MTTRRIQNEGPHQMPLSDVKSQLHLLDRVRALELGLESIRASLAKQDQMMDELSDKMDRIEHLVTHGRGVFAGLAFIISVTWTVGIVVYNSMMR